MTTAADALISSMSEDELLTAIVEAAQYRGWLVHHIRRSDKAVQQGNPGFPDLVLARNGTVVFFELKSMNGRATGHQEEWLRELGPEAYVVTPDMLDTVLVWLR